MWDSANKLRGVNQSFYSDYLYQYLTDIADEIKGIAMGSSTMPMLSKSDFEKIMILKPHEESLIKLEQYMIPVDETIIIRVKENPKLDQLKDLLLAWITQVGVEREIVS